MKLDVFPRNNKLSTFIWINHFPTFSIAKPFNRLQTLSCMYAILPLCTHIFWNQRINSTSINNLILLSCLLIRLKLFQLPTSPLTYRLLLGHCKGVVSYSRQRVRRFPYSNPDRVQDLLHRYLQLGYTCWLFPESSG